MTIIYYTVGQTTFIEEPSQILVIEKNAPIEIQWQIQSMPCPPRNINQPVSVGTQNHTLYPNLSPDDNPIEENTEYNISVTEECQIVRETRTLTFFVNVTLTLIATDNVLRNIQYVFVEATISNQTAVSTNALLIQVDLTTMTEPSTSTSITTTGASESVHVHCATLLLLCSVLITLLHGAY